MDFKAYTSTWLNLKASNRFLSGCIAGLLLLNFLLTIGWLKKDVSVILLPPDLSEHSEISKHKASEGYKKAWGMYAATLIGNVTPENADFIIATFSDMVTSDMRSVFFDNIARELDELKNEKVSSLFDIRQVAYEPETDKVFVTGHHRLVGSGGKTKRTQQTFEFKIAVQNYSPIITHMAAYSGSAKLVAIVKKEDALSKRSEARQPIQKPAL
jgi:conjugal transfer pilus assembly protein TraE